MDYADYAERGIEPRGHGGTGVQGFFGIVSSRVHSSSVLFLSSFEGLSLWRPSSLRPGRHKRTDVHTTGVFVFNGVNGNPELRFESKFDLPMSGTQVTARPFTSGCWQNVGERWRNGKQYICESMGEIWAKWIGDSVVVGYFWRGEITPAYDQSGHQAGGGIGVCRGVHGDFGGDTGPDAG